LLIISIASACTSVTTSSITNTTLLLDQADCIYISDINATINITDYRIYNTINMTPYETETNLITQTTYRCDYDLLNIDESLPHSGTFTESNHNITVTCAPPPTIDQNINVTAGSSAVFASYNLTVNAVHQNFSINKTLDYNESYYNELVGIHIFSPETGIIEENLTVVLNFNETYVNEDIKLNVTAPEYPYVGENSVLKCGEFKEYPELGIKVSAPTCLNINQDLKFGEDIIMPEYGLHIEAPDPFDLDITLKNGTSFNHSASVLHIGCETPKDDYIHFCQTYGNQSITKLWEEVNLTNFTCRNVAYMCVDEVTEYCTVEEKFSGEYGFISCYNRNLNEMQTHCTAVEDELNICQTKEKRTADIADDFAIGGEYTLYVILGLGAIITGILVFIIYLRKKNRERKSND